ncbi:glycosyltransferase [Lederbergia wuyishanensis]|uniref:Glycosyltransferase involved in cell wall biosynthesis n=1 Tax=Lederbergia wuyishanensis TaxID=1347903 RepID=A0ABU0D394_9BACI|nr:glycosyltransferase [Lederbergia wuyishanensis]MCJ8007971.1 glycosyltransferase [Lederbergia wuyishanensis]MDQ0342859.1 glycosyltransferase involved in cell wall biosynthesis [Lederbergia wuyishanensis]
MSRKVFMLLYDIDVNKGGITSVILSRSAELTNLYGFSVDLVSLDYKKNYNEIREKFIRVGRLSPNVNILNVHDYYKSNNCSGIIQDEQLNYYKQESQLDESGYHVQVNEYKDKHYARYFRNGQYIKYKKWSKDGNLIFIDHFNENRSRVSREEFDDSGYITRKIYFDLYSNKPKQELLYTKDGFCYLNKWYNHSNGNIQKIFLFNKNTNKVIEFNSNKEFHVFWLNELCGAQKEKPYLICDGVGSASKVLSMDPDSAYRIYTIHTNHFDEPYVYGSNIKEDHITLLDNLNNVEALVVLTESQKKDIIKQFGDYNNVHVIPNFITPIKDYEYNRDPNLVTMISRYHPEKRIDETILAFKKVIKELPNAVLEIYGHGEDEDRLKNIIKKSHLENNVFLRGYTTKIGEVLGKSNLSIITSKFEGLNVASLESMSCKVPVLSYDVNYGMSDIIKDGVTGFLVPNGDRNALANRIIEVLSNPGKMNLMGAVAQEFVNSRYSKERVCRLWNILFDKLDSDRGKKDNRI